jgi:hypothetical protein
MTTEKAYSLAQWCAEHESELQSFSGQYVALGSRGGIIAHGTDLDRVSKEALAKDPDAVFHLVPDAEVMVL